MAPPRHRGRGSPANPTPTASHGGSHRDDPSRGLVLSPGACVVVHFDVPIANGREIISVDCRGRRTRSDYSNRCRLSGPVIFVAAGRDGMYFTDCGVPRGRFESIDQLMHAFGARWPAPCTDHTPCEEQQHVGSSASVQTPVPDGLQNLAFRGLPCKGEHVAEPASAQTLQKLDVLSLKELLDTTTLEESSITATSLSSLQDIIEASPPSGRCLSSSPIWVRKELDWGFTFYTMKDLRGSFRTYPHVGGPFQSLDEAYNAIDRYLHDHRDTTMGMELSRVDKVVRQCLYYPDGTRKKRSKGEQIDERRDRTRQLVQALVDKYNDYHNLLGDFTYELKDVVHDQSIWEHDNRMYYHINFTTKTKGSDGSDSGNDNLFFAEVTYMLGEHEELVVNCCCMVKPFDNGHCYGCGKGMKHPNDADAYTGGHLEGANGFPFGGPNIEWSNYSEDFEAEEARLRFLYKHLDGPMPEEEHQALLAPCEV